ncbi:MAG: methyltransferase domain-containing protein [Clostridiales bacterium]|jgi:SAM-dependent methyltransferase|nr:methyltransferase domain-containing protein [Clostridiales bacterium]
MYDSLPPLYDRFMRNAPYARWTANLVKIWKKHRKNPRLVLDLGCGTGSVSVLLAKMGKSVIGLDNSAEMLTVARGKSENLDILYIRQDMRAFELYGTVDSVVSLCDSMNYLLTPAGLLKTLRLVRNYLNPGGLFIFDLNTRRAFTELHRRGSFGDFSGDSGYVCQVSLNRNIVQYLLNFFVKNPASGEYTRFAETHFERAHSFAEIRRFLRLSGLKFVEVLDAETMRRPRDGAKRIYVVSERPGD